MQNAGSTIFLVLFIITTVLVYIAIRRSWAKVSSVAVVGIVANVVFFALYSLVRGNTVSQAVLIGFLFGVLFTAAAISIAAFFRSNPL